MKKVLVTGSGTLIGNTIANMFLKKGFFVYFMYNKTKPKVILKKNYLLLKVDLKKKINNKKLVIDYLVHCASGVPSDNLTKKEMYNINISGLKKILNKFKFSKKIIFISTMSVYGKINTNKVFENTVSNTLDFYGSSKKQSEELLKKYIKNKKLQLVVFRLPGIIGPKSKNNFLSNLKYKFKNNLKINISNLKKKFNNVMHVQNLSEIIFQSIKINKKILILNIANLRPLLISSILKLYKKKFNKYCSEITINKDSHSFIIDTCKLNKYFRTWTTKKSILKYLNEN